MTKPAYRIASVLVVDDEEAQRLFVKGALEPLGYEVVLAKDGQEALKKMAAHSCRVALVDLKMPGMDGLKTVAALKAAQPDVACILMTAHATEEVSLGSLQRDLASCLVKPVDVALLRSTVQQVVAGSEDAEAGVPSTGRRALAAYVGLAGGSHAMAAIRRQIDTIAATEAPILLVAEPGSRVDTVARAIHDRSPRANAPFVPILGAALRDQALVSFFFGEQWTGQEASWWQRPGGKLKEAQGGTLFLEGLTDLPLVVQWQLLQLLQAQAEAPRRRAAALDVQVIVASTPAMDEAVRAQRLLAELQHRLAPVTLVLPPLRQRREDIPKLLQHYLAHWTSVFHRRIHHITVQALEALLHYAWPRNLAELEECIQHVLVLQQDDTLTTEHLPPALQGASGGMRAAGAAAGDRLVLTEAVGQARARMERQLILNALEQSGWNRTQAAKTLGVSRKGLHNKMKRYAITPPAAASEEEAS